MRRRLALAAILPMLGATLQAQRVVSSIDVSGTNVWYADSLRSAGTSITPAVQLDWTRATIDGFATISQLGSGGFSMQGGVSPSVFTPNVGPFTAELAGSFGGSEHQDGTHTGQALGLARVYYMNAGAGAWIGGGAGRTWDGVVWRNVRQGEAGAWVERNGITALATLSPVIAQDTIHYTDAQGAVRYAVRFVELGVTAGARSGSVGAAVGGTSRAWGSISVLTWLTPRLALVGDAGTYPVDLTQGYPGGRFVTVSLRIGSRDARTAAMRESADDNPIARAADQTKAAGVESFSVRTVRGTTRELRVYAPSAESVEINADFTQWQPLMLTRAGGGWWSATRPIAPGTYQLNVRVNGGPWLAPPGLLTTTDEFGGIVGLLTIE